MSDHATICQGILENHSVQIYMYIYFKMARLLPCILKNIQLVSKLRGGRQERVTSMLEIIKTQV